MTVLEWVEVDGYENIPVGEWLVRTEAREGGGRGIEYHTATVHEKVSFIGGHFAYDLPQVTHYAAFNRVDGD